MSFLALVAIAGLSALALQIFLFVIFSLLPPGPWKSLPAFTAHRVVSFTTMIYVTVIGGRAWLFPDAAMTAASATSLSRIVHAHPDSRLLAQLLLGLNVFWDIPAGFAITSLRERSNARTMLVHHLVVVLLSYLVIDPPRFHYYVAFFFGLIEMSSVPMALMDLCHPRNAPWFALSKRSKGVALANSVLRGIFAISYMVLRAVCFPYVMFTGVLPDIYALLHLEPPPPVSKASLLTVGVSGILLTGLQLHWAWLIVQQAVPAKKRA